MAVYARTKVGGSNLGQLQTELKTALGCAAFLASDQRRCHGCQF